MSERTFSCPAYWVSARRTSSSLGETDAVLLMTGTSQSMKSTAGTKSAASAARPARRSCLVHRKRTTRKPPKRDPEEDRVRRVDDGERQTRRPRPRRCGPATVAGSSRTRARGRPGRGAGPRQSREARETGTSRRAPARGRRARPGRPLRRPPPTSGGRAPIPPRTRGRRRAGRGSKAGGGRRGPDPSRSPSRRPRRSRARAGRRSPDGARRPRTRRRRAARGRPGRRAFARARDGRGRRLRPIPRRATGTGRGSRPSTTTDERPGTAGSRSERRRASAIAAPTATAPRSTSVVVSEPEIANVTARHAKSATRDQASVAAAPRRPSARARRKPGASATAVPKARRM